MPAAVSRSTSRILRMGNLCPGMSSSSRKEPRPCRFEDHPTVPFAPVHRLIVIPERMIGINRNDCSRSIGTADRDGPERAAQRRTRALIWRFYRDLKTYRQHPTPQRKAALRARFDRIFTRKTGFVTLDRLLARLHANKHELLMVLDRPEIPLHTNGSENDIRCQVTKRKVSGGTRSDTGRDCRDAFLGLSKTCAKLGFAFWDYLGSRLAVPNQPEVPYLPAIVRHRCATA